MSKQKSIEEIQRHKARALKTLESLIDDKIHSDSPYTVCGYLMINWIYWTKKSPPHIQNS